MLSRPAFGSLGLMLGLGFALAMKPGPTPAEPIRVLLDPALPDVAMAFPEEHTISLNPTAVLAFPGPLLTFFLYHEQAHLALRHMRGSGSLHERNELAADCWAAQRADPQERLAAIRFFSAMGQITMPEHPSGVRRAVEVARCGP